MNASNDTENDLKLRLILVAEKLFADHGVEAVSLRQINTAAGSKNTSAIHYHFGSKDAVIQAIFDLRKAKIDEHRLHLLKQVDISSGTDYETVRLIVSGIVSPLADVVLPEGAEGRNYVRLLARIFCDPSFHFREDLVLGNLYLTGMRFARDHILDILTDIPEEILKERMRWISTHFVFALSNYAWEALRRQERPIHESQLFFETLIDYETAALVAPPSPRAKSLATGGI